MPPVPGLRSPYAKVGRLVFFGRMLDKIRLNAVGRLPAEYVTNLGDRQPTFADGRCCRFLAVPYAEVRAHALATTDDAAVLAWAHATGGQRTDEECEVWNGYMAKLGWRDRASERLRQRAASIGLGGKTIETLFDLMDFDEGRDPVARRAWELREPLVIVLMGVAGSGKTTIGHELAAALGWSYRDADAFHPPANVAKMSAGIPLTDADREPWLEAIRAHIDGCLARGENAVVSCSALRERYRRVLTDGTNQVQLVHLAGDYGLILQRLEHRQGHFMKPEMLQSQFAALEAPTDALTVDIALPPAAIVAEIRRTLHV